jgi:hypothetical protein
VTTAAQLTAYMGSGHSTDRMDAVLAIVTAQVKSYTRGQGFTDDGPAEDLEAVILTVAARLVSNPSQVKSEGMGGITVTHAAPGFTIPELFVLNRYRDRAI